MKPTLINSKWIRIGFNLGIGIFIAGIICYSIMGLCMYVVFIALTMLNIAVTTALPYIIYALIGLMLLVVLIIIPAVTGKTIAQIINRRRLNTIIQAEGSQEKNV